MDTLTECIGVWSNCTRFPTQASDNCYSLHKV